MFIARWKLGATLGRVTMHVPCYAIARWKLGATLGRVTMHVPCYVYRTLEVRSLVWPCDDTRALQCLSHVGSYVRSLALAV